jgi:hypothetical protein
MRAFRLPALLLALLIPAGAAMAQAGAGDWISYRDAYRAMVVFDKYGKPKNFLQSSYQVIPRDKTAPTEGLVLSLTGKTIQINLPLDAAGRTVLPMLKVAYDENAVLTLNHSLRQYQFRPRVSIRPRADGVYDVQDLRTACEQALAFRQYVEPGFGAHSCAGVRFVFRHKADEPVVKLRLGERDNVLPVVDGAAFGDDGGSYYKVANYRFGDWPGNGHVVLQDPPLLIAPVFE